MPERPCANLSRKVPALWLLPGSLLAAVVFCLVFSVTTSPFYPWEGLDQAVIKTIGKGWAEGHLPYVALWDHKGPLFFLINAVGYLLTSDRIGIFMMETLFISAFIYFVFRTGELAGTKSRALCITGITLLWLGYTYDGGDRVEIWILPFLMAAFYLTAQWLRASPRPSGHPPGYAFLHGVILSVGLLTRLTDALPSCGIMLGAGILLIARKEWKNLLKNILAYILGFALPLIPFIVYFAAHHALGEAVYGTITHNILYAAVETGIQPAARFYSTVLPGLGCFFLSGIATLVLIIKKEQRPAAFVWLLSSLGLAFWLIRSLSFIHYFILCVPFIPMTFLMLQSVTKRRGRALRLAATAALLSVPLYKVSLFFVDDMLFYRRYDSTILAETLSSIVPQEERNSFLAYHWCPDIYLKMDCTPGCRYFFCLDWISAFSADTRNLLVDALKQDEVKWILAQEIAEPDLRQVIHSAYRPTHRLERKLGAETEHYTLWRLQK